MKDSETHETVNPSRAPTTDLVAEIVRNDQTHRYFLRVKLRSAVAPKNWSQTLVPFGRGFKRRLQFAAASLAEHQCLHFGDQHDPSEVSRAMVRLAGASMAQASRRGPR